MNEWFGTVFPNDPDETPQDFTSYEAAKEYGEKMFGEGNYTIESPSRFMARPGGTRAERS